MRGQGRLVTRIVGYCIADRMPSALAVDAGRRRQRALGKTTPIEFETIYWPAHAA